MTAEQWMKYDDRLMEFLGKVMMLNMSYVYNGAYRCIGSHFCRGGGGMWGGGPNLRVFKRKCPNSITFTLINK